LVDKAHIVENTAQEKLITEYRLMLELSHPFIVQCFQGKHFLVHVMLTLSSLYSNLSRSHWYPIWLTLLAEAFQCKKYIYFLMGLLPGGEVLDLLDEHKKFSEDWSRFYCGAVVLVFEYLHQQKIAYRDLKPENLVLDEEGYCVVVDFGLAKRCDRGKTWTMCGTPDYLAPEIITGKGHDWGVDYWALGGKAQYWSLHFVVCFQPFLTPCYTSASWSQCLFMSLPTVTHLSMTMIQQKLQRK